MKALYSPRNILLLIIAFVMGFCVMSLEMIGGRFLTPYFGSSIEIWGAIIGSTLGALTVGYFMGGFLADKYGSVKTLALITLPAAIFIAILPFFVRPVADTLAVSIENYRLGGLIAACVLLCPPLIFMAAYSPFIIRLVLVDAQDSGKVSGSVYGISNLGSIVGTLFTTFIWIPAMGSRAITFCLAFLVAMCLIALFFLVSDEQPKTEQVPSRTG